MSARTGVLVAALPFLLGVDLLQSRNHAVEQGNAQMKAGKAEQALAEYDKAVKDLPNEPAAHFNRGAALWALSRYEDAIGEFLRATEAKAVPLKAAAFYNLGNSFFKADKFGEAVEAYKRSLALDPTDVRAKWNLELALKKKKEEEDKKKGDDKKKDDKNKQDKKDKKDDKQDKKDNKQDKKEPDKPEPQQQNQQDQQQQQQQQQPPPEKQADRREIDAVLDSLEKSPKALEQERARLRAVRRAPPAKDW